MEEIKLYKDENNIFRFILFIRKEPRMNFSCPYEFIKDSRDNIYEICLYSDYNDNTHFEIFTYRINSKNKYFISDLKRIYLGVGHNLYVFVDYPYLFSIKQESTNELVDEWIIEVLDISKTYESDDIYISRHCLSSFTLKDFVLFMKDPYRNGKYLFIYLKKFEENIIHTAIKSIKPNLKGKEHIITGECVSFDFDLDEGLLYIITKIDTNYKLTVFDMKEFDKFYETDLDIPKDAEKIWIKVNKENIWLITSIKHLFKNNTTEIIKLDKKTFKIVDRFEIDYCPTPNLVIYKNKLIGLFIVYSQETIVEIDLETKEENIIEVLDDLTFTPYYFFKNVNNNMIVIKSEYQSECSNFSIKDRWIITEYPQIRIKLEPSVELVKIGRVDFDEQYSFLSLDDTSTSYIDSPDVVIVDFEKRKSYEFEVYDELDEGVQLDENTYLFVTSNISYILLRQISFIKNG